MENVFDGHSQAREVAEALSKKEMIDVHVVKIHIGNIKYQVTKSIDNLQGGSKILDHYKNGNVVK